MMKNKALKISLIAVGGFLATVLTIVGGFLIYASATTLKVKDKEEMEIKGNVTNKISKESQISLLTWNIGYGALDERQDCYWDGGKGVDGESKEIVQENVDAYKAKVKEINPDIFFTQEVDIDSKRSYHIDELASLRETFDEEHYDSSLACHVI